MTPPPRRRFGPVSWATTTQLCHEYGLPEKLIRQRVRDGDLVPTYTGPGLGRWSREDFAAQIAGPSRAAAMHLEGGVEMWRGDGWQLVAQPGRAIAFTTTNGGRVLLDVEWGRSLVAALTSAVTVADSRHPDCECRELYRNRRIEMIVPVPSCPVHHGETP